jgi:protein PhnA
MKDLKIKGARQVLKRGTVVHSIRLTGDAREIDCRHDTIEGLVPRAEFVKKNRSHRHVLEE